MPCYSEVALNVTLLSQWPIDPFSVYFICTVGSKKFIVQKVKDLNKTKPCKMVPYLKFLTAHAHCPWPHIHGLAVTLKQSYLSQLLKLQRWGSGMLFSMADVASTMYKFKDMLYAVRNEYHRISLPLRLLIVAPQLWPIDSEIFA